MKYHDLILKSDILQGNRTCDYFHFYFPTQFLYPPPQFSLILVSFLILAILHITLTPFFLILVISHIPVTLTSFFLILAIPHIPVTITSFFLILAILHITHSPSFFNSSHTSYNHYPFFSNSSHISYNPLPLFL